LFIVTIVEIHTLILDISIPGVANPAPADRLSCTVHLQP